MCSLELFKITNEYINDIEYTTNKSSWKEENDMIDLAISGMKSICILSKYNENFSFLLARLQHLLARCDYS